MREITSHKVNPANDVLSLHAVDGPGSGGASHHYCIDMPNQATRLDLFFQNGPIAEAGVNGITHEVLLAVLIDRMEAFQAGPFANAYNDAALSHLRSAAGALHDRTRERMRRGVEGTHTV